MEEVNINYKTESNLKKILPGQTNVEEVNISYKTETTLKQQSSTLQ